MLEVARRKSGNYTVRRPLEIGAAMAGCGDPLLTQLGGYGEAVGEAFQLRDDLLGIFGSPAITGKPVGADLTEHKATSVVVAAHHMADPTLRRQLTELMSTPELDEADVGRWRTLIAATGAVQRIEEMIADRLRRASEWIDAGRLDECGALGAAQHGLGLHPAGGMMRTVGGTTDHVVVVGAGLAGLSAALHLAGRGRAVTVVERGDVPGGRVGRLDIDGYRLDTGPTVLTMPDLIDDTFAAVGESTADRLAARAPSIPPIARCSPTAARWTCTATATRWPPRWSGSPGRSRRRVICGCATG